MLLSLTCCLRVCAQERGATDTSGQSIGVLLESAEEARQTPVTSGADQNFWDFAGGYTFLRFNSRLFRASTSGVNVSTGYGLTQHVEIEGQISGTMGDPKPGPYDLKYLFCGGGAILSTGKGRARPFVRGLVGSVHVLPQTAYSNHSFAALSGVGTEIGLTSDLKIRIGADYIRSQLYHSVQNNVAYSAELQHRF
jgi:hypothetical protein